MNLANVDRAILARMEVFMKITNDEKVCSFFASDYHFEMITLPYIKESIEKNKKVIVFTENNLETTIDKVLKGMNLDEKMKSKILDIDWGNKDSEKIEDLKKANNENKEILILVKGKEQYIKNIEDRFSKMSNNCETEIIDCYDVNEIGDNTEKIAKNYDKVLNTVGKILLEF